MSATGGSRIWGPLVALWLIWGSTYLGTAVMARTLPPLTGSGGRFLIAAVILAVVVAAVSGPRALRISAAQFRALAVMATMLLAVGIGTLSLALRYVPSGIGALLVAVMPLWIIVFRLQARQRPARRTLAGVAVGMIGLAALVLPGGTTPVAGTERDVLLWSLAIVGSNFLWALFSWRSPRYDLPANAFVTTTYEMAIAAVVLMGAGAVIGERVDPGQVTGSSWWAFAFLVAASIGGFGAYTWLLGRAPLSLVSTYAYVNPVVAVLLGWLLLGEAITSDVLLGLTVIVGGVALVVSGERMPAKAIESSGHSP